MLKETSVKKNEDMDRFFLLTQEVAMKLGVDVEKSKKEIKGVEKYGMKSLELRA